MVGTIKTRAFNSMQCFKAECRDITHRWFTSELTGFTESVLKEVAAASGSKLKCSTGHQGSLDLKHMILLLMEAPHKKKLIKEAAKLGKLGQGLGHNRCADS